MIVMSRMMIRKAHSGAAGNQTICAIAFTATKITANQRAPELPANKPSPVRAIAEPRSKCTQPQSVMSATSAPWPPTITMSSFRIAASPHRASREPTMKRTIPAKTVQPVGWRSRTDLVASIYLPFSVNGLADDFGLGLLILLVRKLLVVVESRQLGKLICG